MFFNNNSEDKNKHKLIRQMLLRAEEKKEQEAQQSNAKREQQEKEQQAASKKPQLTNLRWQHSNSEIKDKRPDFVQIGDEIILIVDQKDTDGKEISFNIHDNCMPVSMDPEKLVISKKITADSPSPKVGWKVSDSRSKKQAHRDIELFAIATSGESYTQNCEIPLKIVKKKVSFMEAEDNLFRHNSAVMLPDSTKEKGSEEQMQITGISVVQAVLNRVAKYADQKVLIAGHTDRSGSEEYNFKISLNRARSIVAVIEDEKDEWAEISNEYHTDEDIQHVLKWAAKYKGWNKCDPGKIDGIIGSGTKAAIKDFQKKSGLQDDGIVGKKTWGAVFDLYQEKLNDLMKEQQDALSKRSSINWAYESKAVGCGEMFPISSEMKSQTDRRVEILFFEEDELPECVCKDGICKKADCPIFPEGAFEKEYINIDGETPKEIVHLNLQLLSNTGSHVISDKNVKFTGDDGTVFNGTTDDTGCICFANVNICYYKLEIEDHDEASIVAPLPTICDVNPIRIPYYYIL